MASVGVLVVSLVVLHVPEEPLIVTDMVVFAELLWLSTSKNHCERDEPNHATRTLNINQIQHAATFPEPEFPSYGPKGNGKFPCVLHLLGSRKHKPSKALQVLEQHVQPRRCCLFQGRLRHILVLLAFY